jgi:hypothetical protein
MMIHQHLCETCGYAWDCDQAKCGVETARRVNKQGPYCELCRHVEMARRYAGLRHIPLVVNWPPVSE